MNEKRTVRILARATNAKYKDYDLLIDLVITGTNRVVENLRFLGIWGDISNLGRAPFILDSDGGVDFGSLLDEEDVTRHSRLNIHDKSVEKGEYFTHFYEEEEVLMTIMSVADLSG